MARFSSSMVVSQNCGQSHFMYTSSDFTKSVATGIATVSKPRLMSQVGRVHADQCVSAVKSGVGKCVFCTFSCWNDH
jgi:hypothetical protein